MIAARSLLFAISCSLCFADLACGQEFLEVTIEGPLTPELRTAIAKLTGGSEVETDLIASFGEPRSGLETPDMSFDMGRSAWKEALEASLSVERDVNGNWIAPFDVTKQEFIVAQNSDLVEAFCSFCAPAGPSVTMEPASELVFGWKGSPLSANDLTGLVSPAGSSVSFPTLAPGRFRTLALNAYTVEILSQTDRDIATLGFSSRILKRPPGMSGTDFLAAAVAMNSINSGTALAVLTPTAVSMDLPEVAQQGVATQCSAVPEHWPFDVEGVAAVIEYNLQILDKMQLGQTPRANILVVDNGVSARVVDMEPMPRFLFTDFYEALWPGYFNPDTSLIPTCSNPDGLVSSNLYGFITDRATRMGESRKLCLAEGPLEHFAPPEPVALQVDYNVDHGGFVGVLSAGGPDLIRRVPRLAELLGVSFAQIMWLENSSVRSDQTDIASALRFAREKHARVVNASLKVTVEGENFLDEELKKFDDGDPLIVAAAGNSGQPLDFGSKSFPAAFSGDLEFDRMIVVGGVALSPTSNTMEYWADSSFSAELVDILAPSANIPSILHDGTSGCYSGTSFAAPQVSFVAAALYGLGYRTRDEVKRRILATADIHPEFTDRARNGRVLNVAHALDVFVDQIWMKGSADPIRGQIIGVEGESIVNVCTEDLSGRTQKGWVDPAALVLWQRDAESTATIWHTALLSMVEPDNACAIMPDANFEFQEIGKSGPTTLFLDEIDRIVPTRLRAALPIVMQD